jgi:hypothetical protein
VHTGTVILKEQVVAGANAQGATNVARHGDLAFAGDARLSLHGESPAPYFTMTVLTFAKTERKTE